jgi:hypothetical protein
LVEQESIHDSSSFASEDLHAIDFASTHDSNQRSDYVAAN